MTLLLALTALGLTVQQSPATIRTNVPNRTHVMPAGKCHFKSNYAKNTFSKEQAIKCLQDLICICTGFPRFNLKYFFKYFIRCVGQGYSCQSSYPSSSCIRTSECVGDGTCRPLMRSSGTICRPAVDVCDRPER